jgi:hypothetical protein
VQIPCTQGKKPKKFTLQEANQKKKYYRKKQNSHKLQRLSTYLPLKLFMPANQDPHWQQTISNSNSFSFIFFYIESNE